ncbi:hypothetical protein [Bythopirellula polymerisocia]|uniref:DUF4142 domain-containing protein n=1 Tax=Bythopirellula polymerisocia TaxID=2528003 RepID=A0A5C6CH27_9BACT|nr:hypothetical protein [Bythopirellula polymerisocia]TWU22581.1 hypothetical protein Pla144_40410 [Bythopirellula polymerisocia]
MRNTLSLLVATISSILIANLVAAQESQQYLSPSTNASFPYAPPEAPHGHSSTYAEGVLRGSAVLVQALGNYELESAQAASIGEDAYSKYLDNKVKHVRTAFAVEDIRRDHYHSERIARKLHTLELRQVNRMLELQEALEYQLTDYDLDWETGTVYWPAMASSPQFARHRQEVERMMARITAYGSYVPEQERTKLAKACDRFRDTLYQEMLARGGNKVPTVRAEYDAVARLLKGLEYSPVLLSQASGETLSMN